RYLAMTMEYIKKYTAKEEHINLQGNIDGLYVPYYLADCRQSFIHDVLKFDIEEEARNGIGMVLSKYNIDIFRTLKGGSKFSVSCTVSIDRNTPTLLYFKQAVTLRGKLTTRGLFSWTCRPTNGGRSFLPPSLSKQLDRLY